MDGIVYSQVQLNFKIISILIEGGMSDNEDNNDDSNNNEQNEPSRLPKPANIDHSFNKLDSSPKLLQFDLKFKPSATDNFSKFILKTQMNSLNLSSLKNNAKIKFETKDSKTKVSVTTKAFSREGRQESSGRRKERPGDQGSSIQDVKIGSSQQKNNIRSNNSKSSSSNQSDMEFNLSTTVTVLPDNDTKLNLRLKDRGQINLKLNQAVDLIPSFFKAQAEYLWQYVNEQQTHKYSLELLYTTGVNRWVTGVAQAQGFVGARQTYHKNETKVKGKIGNHSDVEIKVNSVNHFGELREQSAEVKQKNKEEINKTDTAHSDNQAELEDKPKPSKSANPEQIKTKLELQNKLTFPKTAPRNFTLRSFLNCEFTAQRQSIRPEMTINNGGFNNLQLKYLNKSWGQWVVGTALGLNWNAGQSRWSTKWECIIERQGVKNLGNVGFSIGDKCYGGRMVKKFGKLGKVELMATRKWGTGLLGSPNFGIKINLNC